MEETKETSRGELIPQERTGAALPAIGGGFTLVPRDFDEALKYAKLLAESELVPKDYRNKPANVLVAVQMGAEVGLKPIVALQNIAVVNGKPSLYGDAGKALLLSSGFQIEEADVEDIKKTGVAACTIRRPNGAVTRRTFSVEDAKIAKLWGKEGPWQTYPYRQLAWRAFWLAARDGAADILKGLAGAEEVGDYEIAERHAPARAEVVDMMPRAKQAAKAKAPEPNVIDGEVIPAPSEAKPSEPAPGETDEADGAGDGAADTPRDQGGERVLKFKLFSKNFETRGMTAEQMRESFKLEAMLKSKKGDARFGEILKEHFNIESRSELTEGGAAKLLSILQAEIA